MLSIHSIGLSPIASSQLGSEVALSLMQSNMSKLQRSVSYLKDKEHSYILDLKTI